MEIVISQGGINDVFMGLPKGVFQIPTLPVLRIVPGIDNIATDGDESRLLLINGLHQSLPYDGVRRFRVRGIVESRIPEGNESKLSGHIQRKHLVIRSKKRLIGGVRPAGRQRHNGKDEKTDRPKTKVRSHGSTRLIEIQEFAVKGFSDCPTVNIARLFVADIDRGAGAVEREDLDLPLDRD